MYYQLKEQQPILDKIHELGQGLEGKALKWHTHMKFDENSKDGILPDWNEDEMPTEEYLEAVELER